jgi:hypothetical protein
MKSYLNIYAASRKDLILLFQILIGFVIAYAVITWFFSGTKHFENLALGTETVNYQARDTTMRIVHIEKINTEDEQELIAGWNNRGKKNVILFLGNSQTHSINQKKDGQVNYIEMLRRYTHRHDILCQSFPNANLQEFYLAFSYWKQKFPVKALVLPLFMDDFREEGIRNVFFEKLVTDRFVLASDDATSIAVNGELKKYWITNQKTNTDGKADMAALNETFQEKTELALDGFLSKHAKAWNNRPNVRGDFFNFLYKARNTVLGIRANTVRKMIPQAYKANMDALERIVDECKQHDIRLLLYIPPIRSDVGIPYNPDEYRSFKEFIYGLHTKYPELITVKNFETIVPGYLWGYKEATNLISDREIDFMHFQYHGHEILADSLKSTILQFETL